jgi:hypothetical protein
MYDTARIPNTINGKNGYLFLQDLNSFLFQFSPSHFMPVSNVTITANVLQLPEGGDFEALHCQPSRNFDRSTKLDLPLNRHFWVGAVRCWALFIRGK